MYSVLLVDDEYLELKTLRDYVDWNSMGFAVTATAKNGREALGIAREQRPDVIITDVRMPVMDGIELAKTVHRESPRTKILFLSGYDEFEYAKMALRVEAAGYLLKPLDMEELEEMMGVVRSRCELDRQLRRSSGAAGAALVEERLFSREEHAWEKGLPELYIAVNRGLELPDENRLFYYAWVSVDEYAYLSTYCEGGEALLHAIEKGVRGRLAQGGALCVNAGKGYLAIGQAPVQALFEERGEQEEEWRAWSSLYSWEKAAGLEELPAVRMALAERRNRRVFLEGPGRLAGRRPANPPGSGSKDETGPGVLLYCAKGKEEIEACVYHRLQELCGQGGVQGLAREAARWLEPLRPLLHRQDGLNRTLAALQVMESLPGAAGLLAGYLAGEAAGLREQPEDPARQIVRRTKELMNNSYGEHLTIESIAEQVYLSPNYLSAKFKEHTGQTVNEYLTGLRLAKAVELLRETSLRVTEISQRVGYENPSYFCALFAKTYGTTPKQFRDRRSL